MAAIALEPTDYIGAVDPSLDNSSSPWWSEWSINGHLGGQYFNGDYRWINPESGDVKMKTVTMTVFRMA